MLIYGQRCDVDHQVTCTGLIQACLEMPHAFQIQPYVSANFKSFLNTAPLSGCSRLR